jgi:hypothetical protein
MPLKSSQKAFTMSPLLCLRCRVSQDVLTKFLSEHPIYLANRFKKGSLRVANFGEVRLRDCLKTLDISKAEALRTCEMGQRGPIFAVLCYQNPRSRQSLRRSSQNFPSRDCLENSRRVLDRLCLVLQESEMGHFRPVLATPYTPIRRLLGLSRQSL